MIEMKMGNEPDIARTEEEIKELVEKMVELQRTKVLNIARAIDKRMTPEDIRNPQDIPALYRDPGFNFEDGILTGYLSIRMALRSKL